MASSKKKKAAPKQQNELAKLLDIIEAAVPTSMQAIADKTKYKYNYVKFQRSANNPSKKLIRAVRSQYAYVLQNVTNTSNLDFREDPGSLKNQGAQAALLKEKEDRRRETEERAKRAETENDRLLTIIENLTKSLHAISSRSNDATGNQEEEKDKN